ncbi:MAG TPA: antibiotic biosynthesis monooxygenase [Longimicrobium sp.]
MIARIWRGETRAEDGDAYALYLRKTGEAECRAVPGNRGVMILRGPSSPRPPSPEPQEKGENDERTEFVFVSFWDSMDAVRAFSGEETERARYYPEDERWLLSLDPEVRHFEVASADPPLFAS